MTKKLPWASLLFFCTSLILTLLAREYIADQLLENDVNSFQIHTTVNIVANVILSLIAIALIKKNGLEETAGLKGTSLQKPYSLIFPLLFLV
ncbi:MAG: CPBP family intramembrane glutamate endopeptidase, partial [Bacteroidota bacterium]